MARSMPCWPLRSIEGALAVLPMGFVGGLAGMRAVLGLQVAEVFGSNATLSGEDGLRLLVAASIVAILSAIAGGLGSLPTRPLFAFLASAGLTVGVPLICAPITYYTLAALTGFDLGADDPIAAVVVLGALMGSPFGIAFAGVFAPLIALMRWARSHDAAVSGTATWLGPGLWWAVAGTILSHVEGADLQVGLGLSAGDLLSLLGLALVLACAARLSWIAIWLYRVASARVSGWALEPGKPGDEALAPVLPWGPNDGVIVRSVASRHGPFRAGDQRLAVWRASLPRD